MNSLAMHINFAINDCFIFNINLETNLFKACKAIIIAINNILIQLL